VLRDACSPAPSITQHEARSTMDVDLDRYREPSRDPEALGARRAALLDQLGWLADEAAALAPTLADLPAWALEEAPLPEERSVKETLAYLAHLDREVYLRWIERLEAEAQPALPPAEGGTGGDANGRDLSALIEDIHHARAGLIARVGVVPEAVWQREATLEGVTVTLYDLLLRVVRHDADLLRALAYRFHEANLAGRT
jgi:hypothetical protein